MSNYTLLCPLVAGACCVYSQVPLLDGTDTMVAAKLTRCGVATTDI